MNKLLIICGPTATGKTALAVRLAKIFDGELVSADSRQVYRGMDIGTGKDLEKNAKYQIPNTEISFKNKTYTIPHYELDGVNVWMVDVVDPDEEFSVDHYRHLAMRVIEDIRKRGKLPILVGGTGLYISSLLSPIETSHIPPNTKLRKTLEQYSLAELQMKLHKDAPLAWDRMNESDRQNPRRLIRKIEIAEHKGDKEIKIQSKEDAFLIGLTASYPVLYERIDARVEKRVKQGVIEEIETLLKKGYSWDLPSMNTFGYKEWKEYFDASPITRIALTKQILERWKWDEHGYARRQMTWFRKMKGIQWFDIIQPSFSHEVETTVQQWYTSTIC